MKADICVIGAGSGGLSVAAGAAQLGASVVLIEGREMGGDCLNTGCVPSKALLAAAKRANVFRSSEAFGIGKIEPKVNFKKVHDHVHEVIAAIAPHDSVERFEGLGVKVIRERARFISKTKVKAGDQIVHAKYFVIATGSSPFVVPIPGIDKVPYLTNETIFNLKEKPEHLIVVGGGPIGCELAQAYHLLGVKTTIVEAFTILPKEDPEVVNVVRKHLKQSGIEIFEKAKVMSASQEGKTIRLSIENGDEEISLEGSHLLLATGRRANVNNLGLDEAGVSYSPRGIEVDDRLRTTNKKIFAIGDVNGGYQFTHVAGYQGGIVIKNCLFHLPAKVNYKALPWVTYTEPEVAHVGMMHDKLPKGSKTLKMDYKESDRAQAERETLGFIKVSVDSKARVLGVSIVGAQAGEMIMAWGVLIGQKLTLRALTDLIVAYPTLSELSKKVAGAYYAPLLFSPKTRRIIQFLLKIFP